MYSGNILHLKGMKIRKVFGSFSIQISRAFAGFDFILVWKDFTTVETVSIVIGSVSYVDTASLKPLQFYVLFIARLLPHVQYFTTTFHNPGAKPKQD